MASEVRSPFEVRLDALQRLVMWRYLSRPLNLVLVSEFPKSGGSWVGQMVAAYLELPFPRNRRAPLQSSIMHGHHLYEASFNNAVCVMRDGRDIMISAYYHWFFENERNSAEQVRRNRSLLSFTCYEDLESNLPRFIEYMFTEYPRGRFRFSWSEFVSSWIDKQQIIVKYEDLLAETEVAMTQVLWRLTGSVPDAGRLADIVEQYSFRRQSGRILGEEDARSFMRKGVAGDWRRRYSLEARQIFDFHGGEALICAGYESDHAWAA